MKFEGCSGLKIDKYFNRNERKHDTFCKKKNHPYHWDRPCSTSEGCVWDNSRWINGSCPDADSTDPNKCCSLDTNSTLAGSYINGGFGFGKLCLDRELTRLILMIIFPPLYVILSEYERGFKNKGAIIMNFILTSLFYIPGLIHALVYKQDRQ
jgi:uncharacterized membrane protein YqaE (UPF0057 family)